MSHPYNLDDETDCRAVAVASVASLAKRLGIPYATAQRFRDVARALDDARAHRLASRIPQAMALEATADTLLQRLPKALHW